MELRDAAPGDIAAIREIYAHHVLHGQVLVHGDPIQVPYGEKLTLRRRATVTRAGWFDRTITKLMARLELTELYEVSFSSGRKL